MGVTAAFDNVEASGFSGVVGIQHGSTAPIIRAFGLSHVPDPESAIVDVCSIAKSITAAAILKLESEGHLALTQTLNQFFELPLELGVVTIHQVLTHSSGLADFLSPLGQPREYSLDQDYEPLSRTEFLDQVRRSSLLAPPGQQWSYSNTGYSLLAAIVEDISGQDFEAYLRRELFAPLGMDDTGYAFPASRHEQVVCGCIGSREWGRPTDKAVSPSWNLIGNGGLLSTLPDLLRWQTVFCNQLAESCDALIDVAPHIQSGYGCFHYHAVDELGKVVYHNGDNDVFSATVRWFPKLNRFLAVVGNHSDHSALQVARNLSDSWKQEI